MKKHCQYLAAAAAQKPRFNKKLLIEPLIIAIMIMGYLIGQGMIQQRDNRINQAEAAKATQSKGEK